jgi:hypothetical protein
LKTDERWSWPGIVLGSVSTAPAQPPRQANAPASDLEYLEWNNNPDDVAAVEGYLAMLEEKPSNEKAADSPLGGSSTRVVRSSTEWWGPADIDEAVTACGPNRCAHCRKSCNKQASAPKTSLKTWNGSAPMTH